MTDQRPDLPDVDDLLGERDALHGWLARLEETGVAAPDGVRERVRRDYQGRLDAVTDALRGHAAELGDRLAGDRAEQADLLARAGTAREALAEAELRHMVGEYDDPTYEAARVRHTSDLEAFEVSLGAVAERIDRLEGIQAQVSSAPGAHPPVEARAWTSPVDQPEPMPSAEPELSIMSLAPDPDPGAEAEREPKPEAEPANDTDAAFLSVFDDFEVGPPPSGSGAAPATTSIEAAPLSFTPREPGGATPPPIGMPGAEPPRFTPPSTPSKPPAAPPLVDPSPMFVGGMVPQPEDLPAEEDQEPVARTVRCGECGALNRPLEWYCEKCGAELTAV